MNQKGFAPVIILLVLGTILAVVLGARFLSIQKNPGEREPIDIPADQGVPDSQAVLVVKTFCDNFFKGPPAINEQGVVIALGLLSQKARDSITDPGPSPSATLVKFLGVYDVPENGYTIDEILEGADKSTIKTTWKYSNGSVTKTFELGKGNGSWKIDSIY